MASQLRVDEIIASTGSSVAIGTAGGSVTLAGDFTVDTSKGLNVGTGATIFSPSSNVLTLGTNSAERVRIDSSGNLSLAADTDTHISHPASDTLALTTGGTERLRITSDGTILMGGQTSSYDGGFVNLELRTDSNTVGGSMTLVNHTSATEGATCEIDCFQNYRLAGKIVFGRENGNNWQASAASAYSFISFHTQAGGTQAEKLRITSDGDVGIGDTAPNNNYGTNLSIHSTATDGARLKLSDGSTGKGNLDGLDIISTGSVAYIINRENADMLFYTNNTEAARFTAAGNLAFPSGKGIDFSATPQGGNGSTMTGQVLDDYEEGTWTPDLRFAGSNTGVSYSWRNGHYTKIGRQVTVRGAFGLSSRGTFNATDDAFIYGLPFDVAPYNITGGFHYMFGSAYNGYLGLFQLELQHSSSFSDHVIISKQTAWNSSVSAMEYQDIGGSQRMAFIFTYFTAS